ncbi:MAG: SO_0444 family Cu/Zn efflux transporter [Planctomycetota bacterium]|nr:SO_0444 family Cu/Zn efflux transporter [Planctomycetota bacterium]
MLSTLIAAEPQGFGEYILSIANDFWLVLGEMSPFLLFGFFFAGLLAMVISQRFVEKHLGGRGLLPVTKATLFGIPLPLCSCGVIPVSASLRMNGASKGSTVSFITSTPQTGVDSIAVTYALMGLPFTLFRIIAALINGIISGIAVELFETKDEIAKQAAKKNAGQYTPKPDQPTAWERFKDSMHFAFIRLPRDIGKPLLVGLLITALIGVFVPDEFFAETFGTGLLAMAVTMLLGLPMYVCATASVPIAFALLDKGATPGAALVFLMTGPATNAAAIATFWKIIGKRGTIVYVLSVVVSALAAGTVMDAILPADYLSEASRTGMTMLPSWLMNASSIALLFLLAYVLIPKRFLPSFGKEHKKEEFDMDLNVRGMTCEHCVKAVTRAIEKVDGVKSVRVDLESGIASVEGNPEVEKITKNVEELGYTVDKQ